MKIQPMSIIKKYISSVFIFGILGIYNFFIYYKSGINDPNKIIFGVFCILYSISLSLYVILNRYEIIFNILSDISLLAILLISITTINISFFKFLLVVLILYYLYTKIIYYDSIYNHSNNKKK